MKHTELKTPYYLVHEEALRRNIELIQETGRRAGAEIIMAFKANALWRTFGIFRERKVKFTASSVNELRLGNEELGMKAHSYCPVYTDSTIDEFLQGSSHITFNSLCQLKRYEQLAHKAGVSVGLRVNPECSVIETDIYNPALPGSRFGVNAAMLGEKLPKGIDGFHFHALCESGAEELEKVLDAFEVQFGKFIPQLKWVNMGGGHLITNVGYDIDRLVRLIRGFKNRYPGIDVILEPGSAWTWHTGELKTSVVDVVENHGVATAIINASFACHMPDCLEMPYKPAISESLGQQPVDGKPTYRLGGNSCLSGDFIGDWSFERALQPGDMLTLEDMNHYTNVKTTMFNGISHPDVVMERENGDYELLRHYDYEDYKSRMD